MRRLIVPLKGVYFDQIAAGTKPEEFRERTPYWTRRLAAQPFDAIVLTRGYPKGGGVEGVTRLTRSWRGFREATIRHPHFGDALVAVFAIDVSQPLPASIEPAKGPCEQTGAKARK